MAAMADLIHVQVVAPALLRDEVTSYIEGLDASCNVIVMADAARQPRGDVVTFDVAREAINDVLGRLEDLGIVEHGSITVFHTELSLSKAAERAQQLTPGEPQDTVIWDEVVVKLHESADVSWAYIAFFVVAAVIGAAGVMTDSSVLIVGAMVVGPEFAPLAGFAFGLHSRDRRLVGQSARAFLIGTAAAVTAALAVSLLVRAIDRVPVAYALGQRSLTTFITDPDIFTVIVAAAAGVAGILALTQDRAGTLVGVLISVTTIPAIAEIGVGIAFLDGDEVTGALSQLGLNLVCLVAVGMVTLTVLRRISPDLGPTRDPLRPLA
jgi:uncharacterized hydrophobic protein (TIGR00271 family)